MLLCIAALPQKIMFSYSFFIFKEFNHVPSVNTDSIKLFFFFASTAAAPHNVHVPKYWERKFAFWLTFKILCRFCTIVSMIECVWGEVLWMWNILNLLVNRYKGSWEPFLFDPLSVYVCLFLHPFILFYVFTKFSSWCENGDVKEILDIYKSGD